MFRNMFFQLTNVFEQSIDLLPELLVFFFFRVALVSCMINISITGNEICILIKLHAKKKTK